MQSLRTAACDTPRLDAEVLLMWAWDINQVQLLMRAYDVVPEDVVLHFQQALAQRIARKPVAYITGEKEFWSLKFKVTEDVLIPRPESEHLLEEIMRIFPSRQADYGFADIGTGSGCLAVVLACEYPHAQVLATDVSPQALQVAQHNARHHGVADRITFHQGSVYDAFPESCPPLDAIVSNPPYLSVQHMDDIARELDYEPALALCDGGDGLAILREVLVGAPKYVKNKGMCVVETGLAGLPDTPKGLHLQREYHDLSGILRGGVYQVG